MSRKALDQKLDEILDFADIGEYINEPVKHYSSGMVVRLGFAVITAVRPQLLVTDEILAVGDESFQKKCIRWMEDYLESGGTLLMVSHNIYQVQKLCQHACWIQDGKIRLQGDVFRVTQSYLAYHEKKIARESLSVADAQAGARYRILEFSLLNTSVDQTPEWPMDSDLGTEVVLIAPDQRTPVLLVGIVRADGTPVYGISSDAAGITPAAVGDNGFRFVLKFHALPLLPGSYSLRVHAMDPEGLRLCDSAEKQFIITGSSRELGFVRLEHDWNPPE